MARTVPGTGVGHNGRRVLQKVQQARNVAGIGPIAGIAVPLSLTVEPAFGGLHPAMQQHFLARNIHEISPVHVQLGRHRVYDNACVRGPTRSDRAT